MPGNVTDALQVLISHLRERQEKGENRVYLTPKGRKDLEQLVLAARQPKARTVAAPAMPEPESPVERPSDRYAIAPVAAVRAVLSSEGENKEERIADLRRRIEQDAEARLPSLRETMVFSVGSPEAAIMFIGEAPGSEEEKLREPFVGPAGQLLTKIILAMGLSRQQVYISNICKFRPAMPDQGARNRPPSPEEMQACLPYIMAEIDVIQPKLIVGLGGTALAGLTGESTPVSRMRGQVRSWKGYPFIVTYHPSYLLRNESMTERRKVWEDMMLGMEVVGLPISEKQRGYFRSGS